MNKAERYSHLLAPIRIAGHTYRSRVVSAPRGGIWNEDPECHDADPEQLAEIDLRAGGGQAAFLVGETPVTAAGGRGANEFYGFDDQSEEHTRRYRQFAQRIHDNGALALVELCHVGQAKSEIEGEEQPIGPMELTNGDGVFIRAMTEEDVEQLCADFVKAARFCQEAGFDGVCLHCGHGWLFHQFLSPRTNQRIDRFGGSLENRSRLSVMVLQALREACGREFILECRVSGSEHVPGGYSLEDICGYCRYLSQYADLIHVSAGLYQDPSGTWQESTLYEPHGCNADVAAAIRAVVDIPVAVVGGGDTALQEALFLAQSCAWVTLVHRRDQFRGEHRLAEQVLRRDNIQVLLSHVPAALLQEDGQLTGLKGRSVKDGREQVLAADGLFAAVGQQPRNQIFANLVMTDDDGYFVVREDCSTSLPGVFAAGDCRAKPVRQLTTAVGDGAVAEYRLCPHGGGDRIAVPAGPPPALCRGGSVLYALYQPHPGPCVHAPGAAERGSPIQPGADRGAPAAHPVGGGLPLGCQGPVGHGL